MSEHERTMTGRNSVKYDLSEYADDLTLIRFRFVSDGGWSDEDGWYDSDGAGRITSVAVGGYAADEFSVDFDGWTPSAAPSLGGGPFRLEQNLAGHGDEEHGFAWAAYDGDFQFPFTPPNEAAYGRTINIGIESPVISIPSAFRYRLEFDVYRDLPLNNLVFFEWQVVTRESDEGCWDSRSEGFLYYGSFGGWQTFIQDITPFVEPGTTELKIRLSAVDGEPLFGGIPPSGVHTPAPFFDNVTLLAASTPADLIEWLIRDVERTSSLRGLLGKLEEALKLVGRGKTKPAVRKLGDFIDQVEGLVNAGQLGSGIGQTYIDRAEEIVVLLS